MLSHPAVGDLFFLSSHVPPPSYLYHRRTFFHAPTQIVPCFIGASPPLQSLPSIPCRSAAHACVSAHLGETLAAAESPGEPGRRLGWDDEQFVDAGADLEVAGVVRAQRRGHPEPHAAVVHHVCRRIKSVKPHVCACTCPTPVCKHVHQTFLQHGAHGTIWGVWPFRKSVGECSPPIGIPTCCGSHSFCQKQTVTCHMQETCAYVPFLTSLPKNPIFPPNRQPFSPFFPCAPNSPTPPTHPPTFPTHPSTKNTHPFGHLIYLSTHLTDSPHPPLCTPQSPLH